VVSLVDPAGAASEAYRAMRTSLFYSRLDTPPKVILIASFGREEGKSTVCANLGVVLAQAGKDVLILDCDFRRPAMHEVFGLPRSRGIVNVLAGDHALEAAYQEVLPGLKVLTAGPLPPSPAELLLSHRLADLLVVARERFDYVLVDSPPIKLFSDASVLAAQADGVLLTLDAQKTRKGDLRRAVRTLNAVGANVLGTVMNKAKVEEESYYQARLYQA
jgi:capsular exopolysaccharide synthesis family protein